MHEQYRSIHDDPMFADLERQRGAYSWLLTVVVLLAYFSFILAVAFAPEWLARPIRAGSSISWGIPIGLLIIVLSFLLTGLYVHRANGSFDPIIRRLLEKHHRGAPDGSR
ncbi:MAG: DUF485 domain-containing protein [Gammaproteobacteria bacterium]|nr:DUF485 domain-containing protein [Gammaproteobacteria bacterium]MCG3142864.1 Inner membrane protein YjcH [Gammaproteobacteria bacterium]